ncbi:hypothetical protein MLD38_014992 [Melastoma candidum]|uniref:Uncharacterized protein n=1 Tax=Melastoma candidum TaxID=119954 RepID=A0ACB9REM7_9MYRT|nr:hypothetical protein MLD38_014992 [Melastoma candidum]
MGAAGLFLSLLCGSLLCLSVVRYDLKPHKSARWKDTLVPNNGVFELRLFTTSGSAYANYYLSIFFVNNLFHRPAWVANRESSLLDTSCVLSLGTSGNLIIIDQRKAPFSLNSALLAETGEITAILLDSEYAVHRVFSTKSDVFSFGVIMLEILSGRRIMVFHSDRSLNLLGRESMGAVVKQSRSRSHGPCIGGNSIESEIPHVLEHCSVVHPGAPSGSAEATSYSSKFKLLYQGIEMNWSSGDWLCAVCQHQNFKKREACQRCEYPKLGGPDVSSFIYKEVLPGDWFCNVLGCGAHNYASRSTCHHCGALKGNNGGVVSNSSAVSGYVPEGGVLLPPGWKKGDWICTRNGCGVHNYASRMECFHCRTPRDYGNAN